MDHDEEDTDLIRVVVDDHRGFRAVFDRLEAGAGRRGELVDHLIAALVRHAVAEEQFLYPAARRRLDHGDRLVDREIAEHEQAERIMTRLQGLGPEAPAFEPLVDELIAATRHHLDEEEEHLLPCMGRACDPAELQDLGYKVLSAKQFAPTRPHPRAPDTPPGNLILGPGFGLVDKIRDTFSGREV